MQKLMGPVSFALMLGVCGSSADAQTGPPTASPAPDVVPAGARQLWQGYSFVIPPGMTSSASDAGFLMSAAGDAGSGKGACLISLLPRAPATGDLMTQALGMLASVATGVFGGTLREGGLGVGNFSPRRGASGAGWQYVYVQDDVAVPNTYFHDNHARLLLIDLGPMVATVVGIEARGNHCLDEVDRRNLGWQLLYYGLEFPELSGRNPALLARQLIGRWSIVDRGAVHTETYTADGRYVAATRLVRENTSFGDEGAFVVTSGDRLSRLSDRGKAQTVLFRIMEVMSSETPGGWLPQLYQLERGSDGVVSELQLTRQWN